jgi:hypothetical protein
LRRCDHTCIPDFSTCPVAAYFKTASHHEFSISRKRKTVKGTIRSIRSIVKNHQISGERFPKDRGCVGLPTSRSVVE